MTFFLMITYIFSIVIIKLLFMKHGSSILVGSIIYLVLGVVGCVGFNIYVSKKTKNP